MKFSNKLFLIFIAFLPFGFALNPSSNIDLNIIRIFIPLFFIFWLLEALFVKKIFIDTRIRFFFLILFLYLIFFSFFWADEHQRALRKILFIFSIIPIYFITFDLCKKNFNRITFLKIFLITGFFQSFLGITQFFSQFIFSLEKALSFWRNFSIFFLGKNFGKTVEEYSSWLVNISGKTIMRGFGTFPDPHLFGLFVATTIPVSFYLYFKKNISRKFFLLIFSFQFFALTISFSRSVYLATIIFIFILFLKELLNKKIFHKKFLAIFSFFFLVFFCLFFTKNYFSERFYSSFNLKEGSNQGRVEMWQSSFEIIKKFPLQGVGIGNFSFAIKPSSSFREPIYAHNLFLDFGAENGIFSIFLLIAIFSSVLINLFKKNREANLIGYIFLLFFVFSFFETPFYSIRLFPLFLIFLAIPNE